MSAADDLDDLGVVVDDRLAIIAVARKFGKRQKRVRRGDRPRCRLKPGYRLQHLVFELFVEGDLDLCRAAFGIEDLVLDLFEFLGDEPLARSQGLLAHIPYRHFVQRALADLYVVAEDLVEPDFERLYARLGTLVALQFGEPIFAVGLCAAAGIELFAEPLAHKAAVLGRRGRIFVQDVEYPRPFLRKRKDVVGKLDEIALPGRRQKVLDLGHGHERLCDCDEVARRRVAVDHF